MKTIKSIFFYLTVGLFISCSNDDDQTVLVNTLATFDYTDSSANAIPDIIFANDQDGQLIAQINTNNIPGIYELKPDQGYASSTFTLITLYPNPSSDTISLKDIEDLVQQVDIYSIDGCKMKTFTSNFQAMSIKDLQSGLYLAIINDTNNRQRVIKFLKS